MKEPIGLMIILIGILVAGSDGVWFPAINIFGAVLMLVGSEMVNCGRPR